MPKASAAIAMMVKPGVWRNMRAECFRSFRKPSIAKLDENITFSSPKHNPVYWTSQKLEAVSLGANEEYLCGGNIG